MVWVKNSDFIQVSEPSLLGLKEEAFGCSVSTNTTRQSSNISHDAYIFLGPEDPHTTFVFAPDR